MAALRVEADDAQGKLETVSKELKEVKQENLAKEQEITSLRHNNQLLEAEVEKLETQLKEVKGVADGVTHHSTQNESLQRRLQLLEDEAEEADKNIRETNEKYVHSLLTYSENWLGYIAKCSHCRLRQTDIKAGHFERKVQALQGEVDSWEKKYEELDVKHKDTHRQLEEFQREVAGL